MVVSVQVHHFLLFTETQLPNHVRSITIQALIRKLIWTEQTFLKKSFRTDSEEKDLFFSFTPKLPIVRTLIALVKLLLNWSRTRLILNPYGCFLCCTWVHVMQKIGTICAKNYLLYGLIFSHNFDYPLIQLLIHILWGSCYYFFISIYKFAKCWYTMLN